MRYHLTKKKALELACRKLNKTEQEIADMRPRTYYWDYLTWILGIAGAVSVWVNCNEHLIRYKTINKKQIATLKRLKLHGLYKGDIPTIDEVKE